MPKKYNRKLGVNARQTKAIRKNAKAIRDLRKPQEMKWLDKKVAEIPVQNGVFTVLNDVTPWDTEPSLQPGPTVPTSNQTRLNSREGDQIVCKRYQFKGLIECNQVNVETVTNFDNIVRVRILYLWINSPHIAGAIPIAPVIDDILQEPQDPINSLYKKNGNLNFRVLKDYTKNMSPNFYGSAATNVAKTFQSVEKYRYTLNDILDLRKMRSTEYQNSPLTAGTNPFKGMLVRLSISDAVAEPDAPVLAGQGRLTFEDEV